MPNQADEEVKDGMTLTEVMDPEDGINKPVDMTVSEIGKV